MSFIDSLNAVAASAENPYGVSVLKDTAASLAAPVITTDNPRVDQSAMSVTCVLTSANPDRQGDIINPRGGDFSEHETNPVVMFHHGKQHKLPIGKAEDRNGNYTVRHVKSPTGNDILIGTTHFAQSNQFAQDVFGLVAEDILRGVSIGFDPPEQESDVDILGPSPSLDRNAMHFKSWKLLEYSHTPIGVNRDALTVKIEKALEGSVKMHRFLLKALQPFAAPRKTVVSVPIVKNMCVSMPKPTAPAAKPKKKPVAKAFDDDDAPDDTYGDSGVGAVDANMIDADDGMPPDDTDLPGTPEDAGLAVDDDVDGPTPGVKSYMDAAQGLLDLATMFEQGMKKSEHGKGRKNCAKVCADIRKVAAEVSAFGGKMQAEMDKMPVVGEEEQPDLTESEDADADVPEPETDDDGAIVVKGYTPRRLVTSDIAPVRPATSDASLTRQLKALERQLKAKDAEVEKLNTALNEMTDTLEAVARRNN